MTFPKKFFAGDFVQWRLDPTTDVFGESISSPDWSVVYYLRTNTNAEGATVNSSAYGTGFAFSIASTVTTNFDAGNWFYQAVANKSGQETQTIFSGSFEVLASRAYTGTPAALDGRTQLKKDLDAIDAAIRAIIEGGVVQEYKIGSRDVKKYELSELIMLRDKYKAMVVREQKAQMIANGLGNPHNLYIRNRG